MRRFRSTAVHGFSLFATAFCLALLACACTPRAAAQESQIVPGTTANSPSNQSAQP